MINLHKNSPVKRIISAVFWEGFRNHAAMADGDQAASCTPKKMRRRHSYDHFYKNHVIININKLICGEKQ